IEWDDRWDGTGFDWELIYIDCIAPLATVTVIDDCPNGQFSLEVNVTSLGDATALDITNTGGAPTLTAVGVGTHIVGPFAIGQVVDLELVHDQSAFCNVQYTGFEAQNCPIPVACGGPGVNLGYCYDSNDMQDWSFVSTGTFPLALLFNSGTIESSTWDHLTIYDGPDATGPILFDHTATTTTDLTGLLVISTGLDLYMEMTSDASVSCQSSTSYDPWDWTVACLDCVAPTVDFAVINDCANAQWYVEVDLSSLGTSATVDITNNAGAPNLLGVGAGIYQVGPLVPGVQCQVTVNHDQNPLCNVNSALLLNPVCPVDVNCGAPPLMEAYCYQDNDNTAWSYQSTTSFPIALIFNSGTIAAAPGDQLTIYNGSDNSAPILYQNTATTNTDLTGVLASSTGQNLYMEVVSNTFTSCASNPAWLWDWSVSCLDCTAPGATFNILPDCFAGTYQVEVVVDSTGSSPDVNIIDLLGQDTLFNVGVGSHILGPFGIDTAVNISVQNTVNSLCRVTANGLVWTQDSCVIETCGPDTFSYCYANGVDGYYVYRADGPGPLLIDFLGGQMLNGDRVVVYNGVDDLSALIFNGNNGGNLAGLQLNSSNPDDALALRVTSNSSGSCADGQVQTPLQWVISCGVVGIDEDGRSPFLIYPNPTSDLLNIDLQEEWFGNVQVQLMDLSGRVVMDRPLTVRTGTTSQLDLSSLQNGNYILQLVTDKWVKAQQVVVAR
ncbi:MAG: T9SS type A sorting domain-containing protein, partial [Flavobacteriales bacterium]|nr:T9SS type A sorting domain-containing protein [Flavobacteriales bacterium]